jgi:acyl carrier protein
LSYRITTSRNEVPVTTDYNREGKTMALSQADVLAGIKEIVEEVAGIPAASIELDKNFTEDLEVDSLSMVEVVVACEERFGVKIPDEKVTDLVTVGDAVNFIVNAAA